MFMKFDRKTIISGVVALLVVAGVGVFVWQRKQTTPDVDTKIRELKETLKQVEGGEITGDRPINPDKDEVLKGVTITQKGDRKLILNSKQGYSIGIPSFLVMARSTGSDNIEFHDPKNMLCDSRNCTPHIQITVWDKPSNQSLDEFATEHLFDLSQREAVTINGRESYKFFEPKEIGSAASFTFFISKEDKVYDIFYLASVPDLIPSYEGIAESFKFIEAN